MIDVKVQVYSKTTVPTEYERDKLHVRPTTNWWVSLNGTVEGPYNNEEEAVFAISTLIYAQAAVERENRQQRPRER
jgi:hypothetical protein